METNDSYAIASFEFARQISELLKEEKGVKRLKYILSHGPTGDNTFSLDDIVEERGFFRGLEYAHMLFRNICCEYYETYYPYAEEPEYDDEAVEDGEEPQPLCPTECPFLPICYPDDVKLEATFIDPNTGEEIDINDIEDTDGEDEDEEDEDDEEEDEETGYDDEYDEFSGEENWRKPNW